MNGCCLLVVGLVGGQVSSSYRWLLRWRWFGRFNTSMLLERLNVLARCPAALLLPFALPSVGVLAFHALLLRTLPRPVTLLCAAHAVHVRCRLRWDVWRREH